MKNQTIRNAYAFSLVVLDALMLMVAFLLAYSLRVQIAWPNEIAPNIVFWDYVGLMALQTSTIIIVLLVFRQYYLPRAVSRVDQLYAVFAAVTLGTLIAVALAVFIYSSDFDFPRMMMIYAWVCSIIFIMLGRLIHQSVRLWLQRTRGWGKDRILLVGSDEMAQMVLQRILWSPQLGYDVVGVINGANGHTDMLSVPVVGTADDLPHLIEDLRIDEVIIAMPEKGHRETVRIIALCERGQVSVKVFPDIFQFVATQPTIDALGGLPLLSVRDYAMRGYLLVFKRLMDIIGSLIGLIVVSPMMMLISLGIKLESPGGVFFVQERMGLDGKPFKILKFRSMHNDAERHGPGWTVQNDPRQTKLGRLLRRVEMDELPQLINVLLGEMSLVGPRPEQPHYVQEFRSKVPRYMDRHRAKAGMTGWAQVNGLRGDTSINERTKFDLWYIENWSLLLDMKIIIRTVWQIIAGRSHLRGDEAPKDTELMTKPSFTAVLDSPAAEPQDDPQPSSKQAVKPS